MHVAHSVTDPVAESRRLTNALAPVIDTANRLWQSADRSWRNLHAALVPRFQQITIDQMTCSVVALDTHAVEVFAGIRAVAECDRLAADLSTARSVATDLPPLVAFLASVGRVRWLFQRADVRSAILEAIRHGRAWESWASISGGQDRMVWALARIEAAARVDPTIVVNPERFPMQYAAPIARALGLPMLDGLVWLSMEPVRCHSEVLACSQEVDRVERRRADLVRARFDRVRAAMIARSLSDIQVARIRDAVRGGSLRIGPLERAGVKSVQDVLTWAERLNRIPGVGEHTAYQVYAAAQQLAKAVEADLAFRFDLDANDRDTAGLVCALKDWSTVAIPLRRLRAALDDASRALPSLRAMRPINGGWMAIFASDLSAQNRLQAELESWDSWRRTYSPSIETLTSAMTKTVSPDEAWADLRRSAADYYAWLGQIVGIDVGDAVQAGRLPTEIANAVRAFDLDPRLMTASLRGYQEFGTKYALVQRRSILGDEMGLGKTVQAIAAMAHSASTGGAHSLVVCPASVLVNWLREVPKHSRLRVYRLHGPDRQVNLSMWRRHGGVGVTTFGQLDTLIFDEADRLAWLVADEAHYLKNRGTRRGRAVAQILGRAERVLFLTGTPLENRLIEFEALVGYVQPALLKQVDLPVAIASARSFRQRIAPVYLRRNQSEVLLELPERIDIDEWVELGQADRQAHDRAVLDGNFMALRRAAFAGNGGVGAKAERLLELATEAVASGRRVVVFSFFRDVLATVVRDLSEQLPVYGPLTGSTAPDERQRLIDRFSTATPGVLVCQVEAGGVGTNIQAASVVILCEPQAKPSTELQAIARVHRMGQIERVQVHRLLAVDSVDQRMLEILIAKQRIFDSYVRDSAVTDAVPEAIDISERELARLVIAEEQRILAERGTANSGIGPGVNDGRMTCLNAPE